MDGPQRSSAGDDLKAIIERPKGRPKKVAIDSDGHGGNKASVSSADALLNAASALMIERNSVNISFVEIAKKAGMNQALIHYHFKSKAGLFIALIERDAGSTYSELEKLVVSDMPADQKMRHHIHGVIKVYYRYPYMNRLVASLAVETNSDIARYISERFTVPLAEAQRKILQQGLEEGTFRPVDPLLFYFSFVGACDHLFSATYSLKWAFGISEVSDDLRRRYADHVSSQLLTNILVKESSQQDDLT
ncbi:TetR family transcriptional regulator [Sphingopyxis granuli]|uniref:TetR family transcriptional regulator n=1 Tax=Sphingopyxis granuli TaxID=267128 RepID=UPI001F53ADAE|nr:TetR family transcriptional regulator [Sphingopyxis granuli]UNK80646.1 TetR family transcriptional regulator [Sphingopyxis granuli]